MDIDQMIGKFYNRLKKADIAGTEGKVAVQFNLTGKITGVFYIEILNGNVSVMPYEYIDHDAIVSGSMTNWRRCLPASWFRRLLSLRARSRWKAMWIRLCCWQN